MLKMINIFSLIICIVMFTEMVFTVSLLKPIDDVNVLKVLWEKLENYCTIYHFCLIIFVNFIMHMILEMAYFNDLLHKQELSLTADFCQAIASMSFVSSMLTIFLLFLIERIILIMNVIDRSSGSGGLRRITTSFLDPVTVITP